MDFWIHAGRDSRLKLLKILVEIILTKIIASILVDADTVAIARRESNIVINIVKC